MSVLTLPNTLRAAAVVLALAGAAFTAVPAQAQSLEFRFGGPGFSWQFNDRDGRRLCMSDREVRRDLRHDGYREIHFYDRRGRIVQLTAELGTRDYEIVYDSCRGRIVDRDRI
jgi:hypothetical protein